MATIRTMIELQDNFTNILNGIINSVNMTVSAMEQMQNTMNQSVDAAGIQGIHDTLNQATIAVQDLETAMQNVKFPDISPPSIPNEPTVSDPLINQPPPLEVPIEWKSDNLNIFTGTGIERFEQEVQSTNNMLNTLNQTQSRIATTALQSNVLPPSMVSDMNNMQNRLQAIHQKIQLIQNNPLNIGSDTANTELERLRSQLNQATLEQEMLNKAVDKMDIKTANDAYLRLSNTVGNTERYIRDNIDEQGRFNREIQKGVDYTSALKSKIMGVVGAYVGISGIKKAFSFIKDCTDAYNIQLNSERQLISVLANMLDEDYVAQFEVDTTPAVEEINNIQNSIENSVLQFQVDTIPVVDEINSIQNDIENSNLQVEVVADTMAAINDINMIQNATEEVVIPVSASTQALQTTYDEITAKASEIQSLGIYGDEAMIAAAAEFATYFTDKDAIMTMMDTLSNYAMGMSGGGEIDATGMVNYATNLGKIMSGSYQAMNLKGFEFTDLQKKIIEGEATRNEIVSELGEEYLDMTSDMQAAAAITNVINESWSDLYERMSNTPQGKIIQLKNAWGDVTEVIGKELYPYILLFLNTIVGNWGTIEGIAQNITNSLKYMLGVLSWLVDGAITFARAIIDNWSLIAPIIWGIIAALIVYNAVKEDGWIATLKNISSTVMETTAKAAQATATFLATAAQQGLNAALAACPITWIIILIIAIIAIIYALVSAINKFGNKTISVLGVVCGVFATAGAFIVNNVIVPLGNAFISFVNFLANVFNDPVASIKILFYDMCLTVIDYIESLAGAIEALINKIPGVTIDITSGLDNFRSKLESAQQEVKDNSEWVEVIEKMDLVDYGSAYDAGWNFGAGIEENISSFFDPSSLFGIQQNDDPMKDILDNAKPADFGDTAEDIADTAGNTKALKDSVDRTEEDLKYMRDLADMEQVNRFTTAEIKIDMTNNNNINNGNDWDGLLTSLSEKITEFAQNSAEGVYDVV